MKKVSAALFLTAALSLGVSAYAQTTNPTGQVDPPTGQTGTQKPAELKDVPAGHWASAAIQIAANCGIVRGFPDGTFRGQEPITRYQAAVIIARLLEAVKNGECGIGVAGTGNMSNADMEALQNAVQELSADLAQLGVRVAELEDNAVTQDDLARVEEIATQARDLAEQAISAQGGDTSGFASVDELARVEEIAQEARDLAEALANGTPGEGGTGIDPQTIIDLTDQVEAASIAADTALAQARELQDKVDEISGRVDDLEGQLGEIGATVEGQADSIAALNDLVVLLNQDVLSLQDRVTDLERQVAEGNAATADALATFATQDDLDSLREFTTLLRRDQTALADRVGELESRVGAVETRITGVESRVTVLENNGFTVAGTLSLNYYRATTWDGNGGGQNGAGVGKNFDVDRLFFGSPFSSGSITNGDYNNTTDFLGNGLVSAATDYGDFGNKSINGIFEDNGKVVTAPAFPGAIVPTSVYTVDGSNKTPYGTRIEGNFDPGISLSFTFKPRALLGSQTNGVGNNFTVALTLALDSSGAYGNASDGSDTVNPVVLKLTSLATKYTVGGAPLSINFGIKPGFKFTDYGFSNSGGRGDGFVATLDGAGLLPLGLTLTTVYGSRGGNGNNVGGTSNVYSVTTDANGNPVINKNALPGTPTGTAATTDNRYFVGFRGTASLIPGFTGGVYYAVEANDILSASQNTVNLYGLNFTGALGPIALNGEYNVSTPDSAPTQVAGFAKANIDLGIFTIATNYRVIDKDYNGLGDNGEYKKNQRGFGIDLGLKLGFATINLYYDQRTAQNPGFQVSKGPKSGTSNAATRNETDFGVNLTVRLIGFDIKPYLTRENETDISGNPTTGATRDRTRYGVDLTHDGSKPDALIGGLNLAIGYNAVTDGLNTNSNQTTLYAYVDTSISLVGFSIAPKAYFSTVTTNGTVIGTNSGIANDDVTNYGGGLSISGGFIFGSTISLSAAIDQSSHSGSSSGNFTSSTGWVSTSLAFNPSIFGTPSKFKVAFASRTDANRDGRGSGPDLASPVGDGAWGGDNGGDSVGLSSNLSGLYFTFNYYGLDFNYGIFALSDLSFASPTAAGRLTFGQAFSIKYSLKF